MTAIAVRRTPASPFDFPVPDYIPTAVRFGCGALGALDDALDTLAAEYAPRRILLITGRRSPAKPWQHDALRALGAYDHLALENTVSNPTIASIDGVLTRARAAGVDFVVALGGGSTLDTGKVVAALVRDSRSVAEALADKTAAFAPVPMLAIPTTAGTGSEVTPFATVWDAATKIKHSLGGPGFFPVAALVDPRLTETLPATTVAGTALDALAHAIESAWSVNATEESIEFALMAVRLVARHAEAALAASRDARLRERLARASLLAGLSIARAQTTIAHAVSYPLTARYGIHHGHACAMSLATLLRFNDRIEDDDCQDPRGVGHVRTVIARLLDALGACDVADGSERLHRLIGAIGLTTFDRHAEFDLPVIAADVMFYDRFRNNPRRMSRDQLDRFLVALREPATAASI